MIMLFDSTSHVFSDNVNRKTELWGTPRVNSLYDISDDEKQVKRVLMCICAPMWVKPESKMETRTGDKLVTIGPAPSCDSREMGLYLDVYWAERHLNASHTQSSEWCHAVSCFTLLLWRKEDWCNVTWREQARVSAVHGLQELFSNRFEI